VAELRCTSTVRFDVIDEATIYLLSTLQKVAARLEIAAVWITSGTDGAHSGPDDPHHHGHALDIRTHNFPTRAERVAFVEALGLALGKAFFVFLEDPDTDNEHVHAQVKRGVTFPPRPITSADRRSA